MAASTDTVKEVKTLRCSLCLNAINDRKSYRSLLSKSCSTNYAEIFVLLSYVVSEKSQIACNWCICKLNRLQKLHELTKATALKQEKTELISKLKSLPGLLVESGPSSSRSEQPEPITRTPKGVKRSRIPVTTSTPSRSTPKAKRSLLTTPSSKVKIPTPRCTPKSGKTLFPATATKATQTAVTREGFDVKVIVKYSGLERSRIVKDDAEKFAVRAILNNKGESTVVKSLAKDEKYKKEMLNVIKSKIQKELSVLTKSDSTVFQGHASNNEALLTYDWNAKNDGFRTAAPYLHSVLASVSSLESKKNVSCMLTSAAILLFSHSQKLSQLQYILGLVLDSCGLTKEGIQIIHDLGISVSPTSIHKKKKALVNQQKKSISKVVSSYVKHVEASRERDPKDDPSDLGLHVDSDMQTQNEHAKENNEDPKDNPSDLGLHVDSDIQTQDDNEYAVENNENVKEDGTGCYTSKCPIEMLGDNLDLTITPSRMTKDSQRKSLHWFLTMVKQKSVTVKDLNEPLPECLPDISELPSTHWIPSQDHMDSLLDHMTFHICCVLLKYVDFLKPVGKCFPKFISHEFMEKTKKKTVFLNCDLIDASENDSQGMIEILEEVHKLAVPHARDTGNVMERIVFGGDVLTNERAFSAQKSMQNHKQDFKSLRTMIHRPEGLHREMNFLGGIYKLFYKEGSSTDKGSLYQLRNLINRRTVIGADEVTSGFRAHHHFVEDVTDSYIVATFLDIMDMAATDSVPRRCPVFSLLTNEERILWLKDAAWEVINDLELYKFDPLRDLLKAMCEIDKDQEKIREMKDVDANRYICVMCGKDYRRTSWMKKHLQQKHHWVFTTDATLTESSDLEDNPVHCFLTMSLLYRDICDAYNMGDGNRIVRNAFFEWLYAGPVHHTKYRLWLFRLICYVSSILTPSESFEYKWNQCVNLQGGIGKCIPNDNCVELQVQAIKTKISTHGSNKSYESAKSVTMTTQVVDAIKSQLMSSTHTVRAKRSRPDIDKSKDIRTMVDLILKQGPVKNMTWASFSKFKDPLRKIKPSELHEWIRSNKEMAKLYM